MVETIPPIPPALIRWLVTAQASYTPYQCRLIRRQLVDLLGLQERPQIVGPKLRGYADTLVFYFSCYPAESFTINQLAANLRWSDRTTRRAVALAIADRTIEPLKLPHPKRYRAIPQSVSKSSEVA
jgi:hypothetical protein